MLKKEEFDKLVDAFENEYSDELGHTRRRLLYSAVNKASPIQFQNTLIEMIRKFNKNTLPSCSIISGWLYTAYPETKKFNDPFDFKLKVVA